mmetsp:Transcript_47607/g.101168  ORF Transcript_47607/g.101168 Transcript_47607/m.101168 type:complete len:91 (-) Transcript_47607:409-681(-)
MSLILLGVCAVSLPPSLLPPTVLAVTENMMAAVFIARIKIRHIMSLTKTIPEWVCPRSSNLLTCSAVFNRISIANTLQDYLCLGLCTPAR